MRIDGELEQKDENIKKNHGSSTSENPKPQIQHRNLCKGLGADGIISRRKRQSSLGQMWKQK